jgi:hypothetical protein
MSKYQEFTRKELYDLVWSTPMTKLAKRFGISDVGLRKICVKHDIPTPPLGYWAKLNFGKPVEQPALGPAGDNVRDKVLVALSAALDLPEDAVTAEVEAREIYCDLIKVPIDPPKDLHPVARTTSRALRSANQDDKQFLHAEGTGIIKTTIGSANVTRAVTIIDTLLKSLQQKGHGTKEAKDGADLIINGERLCLTIGETRDKVEHLPTKAELKARAEWEERRIKWPSLYRSETRHWRSWDHVPSGRLSVTLTDPLRGHWHPGHLLGRWHDRKSTRIEGYLGAILVAAHVGSALVRHNRMADEAKARRRLEEAEARERERQRQRRIAQLDKFIEGKADEFARLQKIRSFRAYLAGLESTDKIQSCDAADDLIGRLEESLAVTSAQCELPKLPDEAW